MAGWPLVIAVLTVQAVLAAGSLAVVHRAMRLEFDQLEARLDRLGERVADLRRSLDPPSL